MTLLNESHYTVVKEYIVFLKDEVVGVFFDESELRAIGNRTNCQVELTNRILNRKIGGYKIIKYAIIQIKGKDDLSVRQCNKLLEQRCPSYRQRQEYNKKKYCCTLFPEESTPDNASLYFQYQRSGSTTFQFGKILLKSPYESTIKRSMENCYWKTNDSDLRKTVVMPSTKQTENYFSRYFKGSVTEQECFDHKSYTCCIFSNPTAGDQINQAYDQCKSGKFNDYPKQKEQFIVEEILGTSPPEHSKLNNEKDETNKITRLSKNNALKKHAIDYGGKSKIQLETIDTANNTDRYPTKLHSINNQVGVKSSMKITKQEPLAKKGKISNRVTESNAAIGQISSQNDLKINDNISEPLQNAVISDHNEELRTSLFDLELENYTPVVNEQKSSSDSNVRDKNKSSTNNIPTTQYSSQFKITTEHGEINLNITGSRSRDSPTDIDNKSLTNREISVKIDVFEDNYLIPGTFENSTNFSKMEGELRSSFSDGDEEKYSNTTGKNSTVRGISTSSPKNGFHFSDKADTKYPVDVHSVNIDISKQNNLQTNMAHNQYQTNDMFISSDTHIGADKDSNDPNKRSHSMTLQITTDSQKQEILSDDKTQTENNKKNSKLITFELDNINYNDEKPSAIEIKFGVESVKDVNEVSNLNLQEFSVANKYDQINYKIANDAKETNQINLSENQEHFQSPELVSDAILNQQKSYSPTAEFTTQLISMTDENMLQSQNDIEIKIQTSETEVQKSGNFDNEITFLINQFLENNDKCVAIETISTTKEMFILDTSDRKSILEAIENIKETSKCKTILHESTVFHPTTRLNDSSINKTSFSNKFSTNQEHTFDNYDFHPDNITPFYNRNKYSRSNESKSTKITTPTLSSVLDIEDTNYSKQKPVSTDKNIKQEDVRLLLKLPLNVHHNKANEISENFQETNGEFQIIHPDNPAGTLQKLHTFRVITNTDSYQFNNKIESAEKTNSKPVSKSDSIGIHSDNKYLANVDILSDSSDINISTNFFKFNANVKENQNQSVQFEITIRNNYKQYANELPITKIEADIPSPLVEYNPDNYDGNILKQKTNYESEISAASQLPYETKTSAICTTEIFQSPADILAKSTNQKHSCSKNLAGCFQFTKEKKEPNKEQKKLLKNNRKHKTEIDEPKSKIGDCLQLPRRKSLSKVSEINLERIENTNENGVEQEILNFKQIQFEDKHQKKDTVIFKRGSTLDKDSEEIFNDNSENANLVHSKKSKENLIHFDTSINDSSIPQEIVSEIIERHNTPKSEVLLQTYSTVNSSLVFDKDFEEDKIQYDSSPNKTVIIPETEIDVHEKRKTREPKTEQQKLISCNEDSGDDDVCCDTLSDSSSLEETGNINLKTKLLEIENNPKNADIFKSLFRNTSMKSFEHNKNSLNQIARKTARRKIRDNDQGKFTETKNTLPTQGIYESIFTKSSGKDSSADIVYCDTSTNDSDSQKNPANDTYINTQIPEAEIQHKTTETSNSLFLNTFYKESEDDNIYYDPSANVNGVHQSTKIGVSSDMEIFKNNNQPKIRETFDSIFIDSFENGSDNSSNSVIISDNSNNAHIPVVSYQKEWRKQNRDNPALATLTKLENLSGMDLLVQQISEKLMIDISCLNEAANYPEIQPVDSESQSSETLFSLKFEIPIEANLFLDKANNNFINGSNFDLFQESISSEISSLTKIPESKFEFDKCLLDDICSMSSDSILNSNFSNSTEYFPEFLSKYFNEFNFSPDLRHIDLFPLIDSDELKECYSDLNFTKLFNENLFCPAKTNFKNFNETTDRNFSGNYAIDKIYQSKTLNRSVEICKLNKLTNTNSENVRHVSSTNIIYNHFDWSTFVDRFYVPHLKLVVKIIANDLQRLKNMNATKINPLNQEKSQILPNFSNEFVCKNYKATNNIPKFHLNDNGKLSKIKKPNSTNNCKFNEWSRMEFGKIADQNATIDCKMITEIRIRDEINSSNDCIKANYGVSHSTDKDNMADSVRHQLLFVSNEIDSFDRIKNWIQQNSEYSCS